MGTFELNRLEEYSDANILEEIKKVAARLDAPELTAKEFDEQSRVSRTTIRRRFGSWQAALVAAGLGHLYSGPVVTEKMRQPKARSDEELLQDLRNLAAQLGRNDISSGDVSKSSIALPDVYFRRFGSWKRALGLAGLTQRQPGIQRRLFTDEQMFANLRRTWEHYGRQPHYAEMNEAPSTIKAKTYWNRFGTWRKALLAFVASVERESSEDARQSSDIVAKADTSVESPIDAVNSESPPATNRDRREISEGLRFRVLRRDHFRCVLCGNSPAIKHGVVLHVDHVLPWSKGGKTVIENLRSLCESCNLGRSNHFDD